MNKEIHPYLIKTLPSQANWVTEMEIQAAKEYVPIMDPISINFLMQLIRISKPKRILEIGTAIGYSALRMLEAYPETSIVTIERNDKRYEEALKNIKSKNKEASIEVLYGDAVEMLSELAAKDEKFDCIFIDAAKGQYQNFVELTSPMLKSKGLIISDNVLFKGYVIDPENANVRQEALALKVREYNDWLAKHPDYTTSIIPIGDGIAISVKRD